METRWHYTSRYLLQPNHPVNIHLVGCGGNGSQTLTGLARIDHALRQLGHPGLRVTVFDPDTVSEANIGRQLFSPGDVGEYKARVLVERVNRFFGLAWDAAPFLYPDPRFQQELPDVLVTAVDAGKTRKEIGESYRALFAEAPDDADCCLYWLDMGNSKETGQVILGTIGEVVGADEPAVNSLPTILDMFPDLHLADDLDDTPSCSLAEALQRQDLFVNQSVVTFALDLLWKLFSKGRLSVHGCFVNLGTFVVNPVRV